MKNLLCSSIFLLMGFSLYGMPKDSIVVHSTDTLKMKIGGALRFNYNRSSWKPNQVKRGGDFGFEMFRINVDGSYKQLEVHIDQRIYSQDFGGAFLKYGWFQYNLDNNQHLKLGLIPSYFGNQQFNSHSWFFQLPFYLGFEDDHDMGISYSLYKSKLQLDIGFYKNAETLSFSDNTPISDARYSYDFSGENKEINQFNIRFNYLFGTTISQKVGATIQRGQIWNIPTKETGSHLAFDIHYQMDYKGLNLQLQYIQFDNMPVDNANYIQMTAYGSPYNTASSGSFYTIGIAYTIPINTKGINSIQIYNDYAILRKEFEVWEDTQMNVFGILIDSNPLYIYIDSAWGKHQPWLGPQWEDALTSGDQNNNWENRFNVNFGYYF